MSLVRYRAPALGMVHAYYIACGGFFLNDMNERGERTHSPKWNWCGDSEQSVDDVNSAIFAMKYPAWMLQTSPFLCVHASRLHIYSYRWVAKFLCSACISLSCCLTCHHRFSMLLVWAPVRGSTKLMLWLTLRCWKPVAPRSLYAFPTIANYCCAWFDVLKNNWFQCGPISLVIWQCDKKVCRVSWHMPPNTHCPSTNLPRLYFVLPNL